MANVWWRQYVKSMLFCCKSVLLQFMLFVANMFCHDPRTFVWRKIEPKIAYVEKKWQIWGMQTKPTRPVSQVYFPTILSNGTYRRIAKNDDTLLLKENVCFSSAFSFHVCFRESFREGHRERQREIRNIVMLPHCHIAILLLSCWLIAVLKTKHRGRCSCCPSNHCSVCIDCRM